MRRRFKTAWVLLRDTYDAFSEHKVMKLSAALSYYTIFSIAPMLFVIIGICGLFFGRDAIQGEIFGMLKDYVGTDAASQIQEILSTNTRKNNNTFTAIVGGATLLLGATGIFGEIQDSINQIWGLKTKPKKGLVRLLFNRLMSFSMIIVLGFILMVSLVLNTMLELLLDRLTRLFSQTVIDILYYLNYGVIFLTISTLFACIFKVLPDARIKWKHVFSGAMVTAIFFMIGKTLISYYLTTNATVTAYGAAGSVIVLLIWVYYSSIILYFGAEYTQVYARHMGVRIQPNRYAVFVEKHEEELHGSQRPEIHPEPVKNVHTEKPSGMIISHKKA